MFYPNLQDVVLFVYYAMYDFGSSVGIASWDESDDGTSAGVVLVGAPLNDENGEDSGQIYSYAICS